jgi:hypothetical protein
MSQEELKDRIKEILVCRWFDVGNWRFSCDPNDSDYYPNQWWDFSSLDIYVMPEVRDLGRGIVVNIDSDIINTLKMHNLKCHPNATKNIESLGLRCQVVNEFDNIDEHIITDGKLMYVPYSYLNHP